MNDVKKFHPFDASVDGVLKLNESMWVLIKSCKVRDCNLDIGTVIFKPDITDYPNTDDLLVMDNISNDQKDLHFKGKVLAPNNPYIYYEDLLDIIFNVTGADYLMDKLPVYDDYESKLDFKHDLDQVGFNLDVLKVFAGKENISNLMGVRVKLDIDRDLYRSFAIVDDNLDIVRYIHVDDTCGLFLRSTCQTTEFVWLSFTDIFKLSCLLEYCLIRLPDALGFISSIKLNNEFGTTLSFIHDVGLNESICNDMYSVSYLERNNMASAINNYHYHKHFDSKLVVKYYDFERYCSSDGYKNISCRCEVAAYDDILSSGVGVSPFNVVLSLDFFKNHMVKRIWVDNIDIEVDNVKEFIVEDVDINHNCTYVGKVVLNDCSIKHNINIEFDDSIRHMYIFTLELTQILLVGRYIRGNGYKIDFNKLSYDLGIRFSLIQSIVDKFNHFYRDEKLPPVNIRYFDKGYGYLGNTRVKKCVVSSISDTDDGIDI